MSTPKSGEDLSRPDESTPLLRKDDSKSDGAYKYAISEDHAETGSSSFEADDESAALGLAKVSSIPQGLEVEPGIESMSLPMPSKGPITHERSVSEADSTGYAARFINVTPTKFWLIFGGIQLGYFVGFFDSTLMASTHPVITSYFQASDSASWLTTSFLLTSTAFMPLFGRVSDTFGRRPVYLFSIFVFLVTTAWCALAQSIQSFIAARAFCGLGAGGVFSMGMIICSDLVRLEYRGIYQSYINLALGVGGCAGLAFGGYICDQVGWRGAFAVQLPFIFVYMLVAAWTTPSDLGLKQVDAERATVRQLIRRVDLTGSFILVLGVTILIMGLNLGYGRFVVISSIIIFCILSVIFIRYERTVERPVMPVSLLSRDPRASLIYGNFFGAISVNTIIFNAPLFFQAVKLASPTDSGLRLVASTAAVTFSSVSTGFLITWSKRLKPTVILGGALLFAGGLAASSMDVDTPDWLTMICASISSLGQGFSFPSIMVSILAVSDHDEQAVATTTLGLWRNLGSVMGVAISSWIFQNMLFFKLENLVTGPEKQDVIHLVRKSVHAISGLDPVHQRQVVTAYAAALRATFFSAAVFGGLMLLLHLRIRLPRLGRKE
ncbi:MFS multidrug transporter [Paecilomyces variotii No. 5]|uniref:MFS multidrug transporter n=1 Tax=Byssochlamys spectabilis (strain No. 5 / NBRC 109023) TaxID=1356009 RepID=V5I456_BYSSN|nr:MFS multidrug transporter [Paecilomyces variotii No. 5]